MVEVIINECWARDGLQNQDLFVPTEKKVAILLDLVDVGFKRIEATSFSHPKYVPQFADAEEVLSKIIGTTADVMFKATCVNRRALERAIQAFKEGKRLDEVSFVMAASNAYNEVNVKMNNDQLLQTILENIQLAKSANIKNLLVSISTAFGCDIQGEVSEKEVLGLVEKFTEQGVQRFTISDTTGIGNPKQSNTLFRSLIKEFPENLFIAHFHDTKGWGIANNLRALESGITHFDTSLGGIGGPPAARMNGKSGKTGNVCTEDFVCMLHAMGVDTGIDEEKLLQVGKRSEEILGKQFSKILATL